MKFKTNLKCDGCIAKVTSILDQSAGAGNWQVDLSNPLRILTIENDEVSPVAIKAGLGTAGYQAEEIEG